MLEVIKGGVAYSNFFSPVLVKSIDPSPGWGLGKAAPAPAGTRAVEVGAGAATEAPLGITTVDI